MNRYIIKLFSAIIIGSMVMTSCLKDDLLDNPDVPQAGFTMINIHSKSDFIIHKADNNYIQTMNNPLSFKGINFVYLYPGNRKIQTLDSDNKVIIDSTYAVKDSILYTSFVFTQTNQKAGQRFTEDKILQDLGNNAAIRFLNFSYTNIPVNVFIGENKIFENRTFDGLSHSSDNYKFTTQSAGLKKISIKNQAGETLVEKDVTFNSRMHYSILFIKNSNNEQYEVLLFEQYRN